MKKNQYSEKKEDLKQIKKFKDPGTEDLAIYSTCLFIFMMVIYIMLPVAYPYEENVLKKIFPLELTTAIYAGFSGIISYYITFAKIKICDYLAKKLKKQNKDFTPKRMLNESERNQCIVCVYIIYIATSVMLKSIPTFSGNMYVYKNVYKKIFYSFIALGLGNIIWLDYSEQTFIKKIKSIANAVFKSKNVIFFILLVEFLLFIIICKNYDRFQNIKLSFIVLIIAILIIYLSLKIIQYLARKK